MPHDDRRWCQYCGQYEGSGKTADTIIVLVQHKGQWRCQNHRPKVKKVEITPAETQLTFEEKGQPDDVSKPV